jgi:hypothetical protein
MDIFIYILLIVVAISAFIIKRDTSDLIERSDAIQKSLNKLIKGERK